eukprot:5138369-Amphidinium_carterae.1
MGKRWDSHYGSGSGQQWKGHNNWGDRRSSSGSAWPAKWQPGPQPGPPPAALPDKERKKDKEKKHKRHKRRRSSSTA